jgi:hypothetical protein
VTSPLAVVACRDPWTQELLGALLSRAAFTVAFASDTAAVAAVCARTAPSAVLAEGGLLPEGLPGAVRTVTVGSPEGLPWPLRAADVFETLRAWGVQIPKAAVVASPWTPRPAPRPRPDAAPALPAALPLGGACRSLALGRLLLELWAAEFTGRLTLKEGEATRALLWRRGVIGAVEGTDVPPAPRDALTQTVGLKALLAHHRAALAPSLGWREATYRIDPDPALADAVGLDAALGPLELVMPALDKGLGMAGFMEALTAHMGAYVVPTPRWARMASALSPLLGSFPWARLLGGKLTFQAFLTSDDSQAAPLARALYLLHSASLVRASKEPVAQAAVTAPPPTDAGPGAPAAPVDYRELATMIERIDRAAATWLGKDPCTVLGVPSTAGTEEVEAAYAARVEHLRLGRLPPGLGDDVLRRAGRLEAALAEARATLTDPRRAAHEAGAPKA